MKRLAFSLRRVARASVCCLALLATGPSTVADWQPDSSRFVRGEGEIEAVLSRILTDINQGKTDRALMRVESLIEARPNFHLAHLVKGDLLRAHSQAIDQFGDVERGPRERLDALREEARARLAAWRDPPPEFAVPRALLQLGEHQAHAVLVDAYRSRLYVFGNDHGRPKLIEDFYISQGKAGAEKSYAGDKRTPLGVYRITERVPQRELSAFYGSGAFALNYPNEWDKRMGRSGHGIWLHGTPPDTYSRPPRASEGCVVLANDDLRRLESIVEPGVTPVIIAAHVQWLTPRDWAAERDGLKREIESWRAALERRDADAVLGLYSERMHPSRYRHDRWLTEQREKLLAVQAGEVKLSDLTVLRDPKEELFVATFELDDAGKRRRMQQYWLREGGQWKIVSEG